MKDIKQFNDFINEKSKNQKWVKEGDYVIIEAGVDGQEKTINWIERILKTYNRNVIVKKYDDKIVVDIHSLLSYALENIL